MRATPASAGITARKKAIQRPRKTALPPRRDRKSCASSRRLRRPRRTRASRMRGPMWRPTWYPTVSPMIAAAITTTRTAGSVTCPSLAATPARRATVSPGSTNPTKRASSAATSRPATTSTVQPGNPRRRSTTALTVRGPRTTATAGRRSRAMPAKGRHGDGRGDPSPGRTRSGAGVLGADRRRRELDEVLGLRGGGTGADERLDQLLVAHSAVERRAGVPRHRQLLLVRRGQGHPGRGHHVQEHRVRGLSRGSSTVFAAVVDGTAELVVEG